jgi:hypothetical protein
MFVRASGFNCGFVGVPQMPGAGVGIFEEIACDVVVDALLVTTFDVGIGPGITEFLSTWDTAALAANFAASADEIFATIAFKTLSDLMLVAPLARSERRIGACSALMAALRAAERAASALF